MEWQLIDNEDSWVFGEKIRGIVRDRRAEVYFDEDIKREGDPEYGWVWFVCLGETKDPSNRPHGVACCLSDAIKYCEDALGIHDVDVI